MHNLTFEQCKRINALIKKDAQIQQKELDKELIFWERMKNMQVEQISQIIHEAVRIGKSIEIDSEKELIAVIEFFSKRGIEGHKIISVTEKIEKSEIYKEFILAYCNENCYLLKKLLCDLLN